MMVSRKNVEISAKIHEGEFRELLHCVLSPFFGQNSVKATDSLKKLLNK